MQGHLPRISPSRLWGRHARRAKARPQHARGQRVLRHVASLRKSDGFEPGKATRVGHGPEVEQGKHDSTEMESPSGVAPQWIGAWPGSFFLIFCCFMSAMKLAVNLRDVDAAGASPPQIDLRSCTDPRFTRRGTWCRWRWPRRRRHGQPCRGRWRA